VEVVIAKDLNVVGDEGLLQVAMTNLLDNAWKFTSKTAGPKIEFGVVKDGPWQNLDHPTMPVFFVADNGVGFDMGFADKLFGAFQRLHRDDEFPGTGVGLATVQRIIKRHNGKIWAESEPCQGATFYFSL
ncbi:MAG: histidine kinase, partial [Desulfuromonadales bacterium]|nr:histidine kinase [Desulfuromonadales bacterium]